MPQILSPRSSPVTSPSVPTKQRLKTDPAFQAFWTLRIGFAALPILMGVDKFAHVLDPHWDRYLAPLIAHHLPGSLSPYHAMLIVGVIEIIAGIVVLLEPRIGSLVVAVWLVGIIVDLLLLRFHGDIWLRDFGLFLGAITLARLAWAFPESSLSSSLKQRRQRA